MVEARPQGTVLVSPNVCSGGMLATLRHRNFRLYFAAQIISNVGTLVQITVENWLVLELSRSGLASGVTNALQFGPPVLFGMYGGVVADRCDRRRLLMLTQACFARVWMIWVAAGALGLIKCFDLPALQGFVKDLVGQGDLPNAVAWTNLFSVTVISTLQSRTVDGMRGRVMVLHSICFLGVA